MLLRPALSVLFSSIILAIPTRAQVTAPPMVEHLFGDNSNPLKLGGLLHPTVPGCASAANRDMRGRLCFYADQLIAPSAAVHALFSSELAEWRNMPHMRHEDTDDVLSRFSVFYERKASRNAGEFLAGYLHHEEFRPRVSGKTGFLQRTRAALLGVVTSQGEDGELRPAFAPVAGALGSGFVAAANFPNHGMIETGIRRSSAVYGCYFGTAMFREFKPDLMNFSSKLLERFR